MNQRMITVLLVSISISLGIFTIAMKNRKDSSGDFGDKPVQNWEWNDEWGSESENKETEEAPEPSEEIELDEIVEVDSYSEALKKSSELGKPVLVFFTSDTCEFCQKMKSNTLTDEKVKKALRGYIFVYVNTQKSRDGVNTFGVTVLPSYVITNHKEEELKSGSGFMNSQSFAEWLNNPDLMTQPKASEDFSQDIPEGKNRKRLRRKS